jgi:hypothetical protein
MADRKGRKSPVQTMDTTSRAGKVQVTPLRSGTVETRSSSISGTSKADKSLTHDQIAARAWALWVKGGCLAGEHDKNWYEAESQLKVELGIQ